MTDIFTCCIVCRSENINRIRGAFPIMIHDKSWKVPGIEYYVCAQCGEKFMDLDNESKIDAYLKHNNLYVASRS